MRLWKSNRDLALQTQSPPQTGTNTINHRLVDRYLVDQYVRIADDLQIFLVLIAITSAVFFGTLVDLTMDLKHPTTAYLILAGSGAVTFFLGIAVMRNVGTRRDLADGLDKATMEVPVSFTIQAFAPQSTSVPTSSGFNLSGISEKTQEGPNAPTSGDG